MANGWRADKSTSVELVPPGTPGAVPIYGGRNGDQITGYYVPDSYKAAQALSAQTAANKAAAHPDNYVWMDQTNPRAAGNNRDEVQGMAGNWVDPNASKGGGFFDGLSSGLTDLSHSIADNPLAMAAITAAATAYGVPPAVTAAALGANRAGKDGNIQAGLETGVLSYAGGSLQNYLSGAEAAGAAAETGTTAGNGSISLSGGSGAPGFGAASSTSTTAAMNGGGLGLSAPVASATPGFGLASGAATQAALGGTTLAQGLGAAGTAGWTLGKVAKTATGVAKVAKDPVGALTNAALDVIPYGKEIKDVLEIGTAVKVLTGGWSSGGNGGSSGGNSGGGGTKPTPGGGTPADAPNVFDRISGDKQLFDGAALGRAIRQGVKAKWENAA